MKQRMMAIILSLAMTLSMIPTYSYAAKNSSDTVVKGRTNISAVDCYDFSFNFRNLTVGSNTVYSDKLSVLSILLSTDMGNPGYIKIANGDGYLLEQLGFEDVRRIDLREKYHNSEDPNDWVVFFVGRKTIRIEETDYVIYAVAVRGTVDAEEWMSNFDFGADTDEYEDLYDGADHSDWIEHYMHKGFNVTANRVYKELTAYIDEYSTADTGMKRSILITGHSRGAAVANILGKKFEDMYRENKEIKPYTYTYGTPNVTTESKKIRTKYKTIFNVVNDDDLVPFIPLNSWGFYRYGRDIHTSVERKYEDDWKADNVAILVNKSIAGLTESTSEDVDSIDILGLLTTLVDGNTYDFQDYKSASGSKAEKFVPGLLSAYPLTREGEFEFNDIVWIPQNISKSYSKYYVEVPYGELDGEDANDKIGKSKFDKFANITRCKRVKVSTMFFFYTLTKIMKTVTDTLGEVTVGRIGELIEYITKNAEEIAFDSNCYKSLLRESELDKDILNLLCMFLVTYDRSIESGPVFVKALKEIKERAVLEGFASAHMPVTYYFLANQNIEEKDIRPTILKVSKGQEYEISGNLYKVTSVLKRTVSLVKAGDAPIICIPNAVNIEGESYEVTDLGTKAFKDSEALTVVVQTKWLTKDDVRSAFDDSEDNKAIIIRRR